VLWLTSSGPSKPIRMIVLSVVAIAPHHHRRHTVVTGRPSAKANIGMSLDAVHRLKSSARIGPLGGENSIRALISTTTGSACSRPRVPFDRADFRRQIPTSRATAISTQSSTTSRYTLPPGPTEREDRSGLSAASSRIGATDSRASEFRADVRPSDATESWTGAIPYRAGERRRGPTECPRPASPVPPGWTPRQLLGSRDTVEPWGLGACGRS
jgi:hypothetical protein